MWIFCLTHTVSGFNVKFHTVNGRVFKILFTHGFCPPCPLSFTSSDVATTMDGDMKGGANQESVECPQEGTSYPSLAGQGRKNN